MQTAVGFLVDKIPAYKNTKTIERTQKKVKKKRIQKENRKNQKT